MASEKRLKTPRIKSTGLVDRLKEIGSDVIDTVETKAKEGLKAGRDFVLENTGLTGGAAKDLQKSKKRTDAAVKKGQGKTAARKRKPKATRKV